jgi:hypothetical protein
MRFTSTSNTRAIFAVTSILVLVFIILTDKPASFILDHLVTAQALPATSSYTHTHVPGLFYYPQDPFHSLFPIRNMEMSTLLDRAGDALSRPSLQENLAMTADGNCEMCQVIKYIPGPIGKAGIAYGSAQVLDLSGAKRVVFFVRGELGGEKVAFVALGKPSNSSLVSPNIFSNLNFAVISKNITLTSDWQRFQLSLSSSDPIDVTYPFGFIASKVRSQVASGSNIPYPPLIDANTNHITFFLKGVTLDSNPAIDPIPTIKLSATNSTAPSRAY